VVLVEGSIDALQCNI